MDALQEEHDYLLSIKPDGASHDVTNCNFCNSDSPLEGGDMNTRMYTEDELTSAVSEAVAPIQAELDSLRSSLAEDEVEARVSAAKAEVEAQVAELQTKLDAAEIRAVEAEAARDEILGWLEAEAAAKTEAEELAARREARLVAVKEAASFSDEHIEANLDRWTALDDEVFEALVDDWKAIQKAARASREDLPSEIPTETAMQNRSNHTTGSESSAGEFFSLLRDGFDPRKMP